MMGLKTIAGLLLGLALALSEAAAQAPQQCVASALAGGTSDALTVPSSVLPCGLTTNLLVLTAAAANTTTTPTLAVTGFTLPQPILKGANQALAIGDIGGAGYRALLVPTGNSWLLINPAAGPSGSLSAALTSGSIFIGNASNVATGVAPSGDISLTNSGVFDVLTYLGGSAFGTAAGKNATAGGSYVTSVTGATVINHVATFADTLGTLQDGGVLTNSSTIVAPQGRLTLQSGTPIQTSDEVGVGTIYYAAYAGNNIPYYTGVADALDVIPSNQVSLALETSGTGVENSGGVFDIWWWHNVGSPTLCVATNGSGGGWASDTAGSNTARGTGYSALDTTTHPYVVNKNNLTHCYNGTTDYGTINAGRATLLGSFYTTAAGKTTVALRPAGASPGAATVIGLSNAYNQVRATAWQNDSTASWTVASANTWEKSNAAGSAANQITYVDSTAQVYVSTRFSQVGNLGTTTNECQLGVERDWSSSTPSGVVGVVTSTTPAAFTASLTAFNSFYPAAGLHTVNALEWIFTATGNPSLTGGVDMLLQVDLSY